MIAMPEPALAQPVGLGSLVADEAFPLVDDLDGDVLVAELVHDLNAALAPGLVRMPDRVRACLRERELEVVERLVRDVAQVRDSGQGEPAERDVLRLRGDGQSHGAGSVVTA